MVSPWLPLRVGLGVRETGTLARLLLLFTPNPRNLENVEAGWGQVLVPHVLALLTGLMAEVRGLPG